MSQKLANKIALVTGSGQGVGQGIAYALASEGATIAVVGRTVSKLETTVAEIKRRGGKAIAIECDIKQPDALSRAVENIVGQLGGLHILVNNAQEVPLAPLLSLTEEALAAGWESGPLATLRLMKLSHPHLKKSGGGNIVNLCTVAAMRWDVSGYGGYAAVKEATRQLTRAAACEWAADGIRTNAILPLGDSPQWQAGRRRVRKKLPHLSRRCRCSASANAKPTSAASSRRWCPTIAATSMVRASRSTAARLFWADTPRYIPRCHQHAER
jgi:NAD(P)-dependent dehydrogenase (short-subunit alcohol dehydrogenase family)